MSRPTCDGFKSVLVVVLIAVLVCLCSTTIGLLLTGAGR